MKQTDLAWVAGIVDGEGSIYARRVNRGGGKAGWTGIDSRLAVAMTHRATIYTLRRLFEIGTVRKEKKKKPGYKQSWRWVVCSQQAGQVLGMLLPFLRTKQQQARLYTKMMDEMRGKKSNRRRLPAYRQRKQDRIISRIRSLNRA